MTHISHFYFSCDLESDLLSVTLCQCAKWVFFSLFTLSLHLCSFFFPFVLKYHLILTQNLLFIIFLLHFFSFLIFFSTYALKHFSGKVFSIYVMLAQQKVSLIVYKCARYTNTKINSSTKWTLQCFLCFCTKRKKNSFFIPWNQFDKSTKNKRKNAGSFFSIPFFYFISRKFAVLFFNWNF